MKKKLRIIIFIPVLIIGLIGVIGLTMFLILDSEPEEEPVGGFLDSYLQYAMGPTQEAKKILNAEDVQDLQVDLESMIAVDYDALLSCLQTLQEEGLPLYGEEGCFVSKKPIRFFSVNRNALSNEEWLIVFSKDFEKVLQIKLFEQNNEVTMQAVFEFDAVMLEAFISQPDEKYLMLFDGGYALSLASDNVFHSGYRDNGFTVEGDYYHALPYEEIGVSYSELICEENLVWVEFKN